MRSRQSGRASAPLLAWGEQLRARKAARKRRARRAVVGALGCATLLAMAAFPPEPRLVWNASASAPIGLYLVSPGATVSIGDMVIARLPAPYRRLAAMRHYLPANVPLIKRVAAAAGDEVCALGQDIFVNGRWITERRIADAAGRPMPLWSGCVRLRGRQLFLLMDAPASFDGRYFGVTQGTDIVGKAQLLWPR